MNKVSEPSRMISNTSLEPPHACAHMCTHRLRPIHMQNMHSEMEKKMAQMSEHGFKIIENQPIASYEKFALKLVLITIIFTNTPKGLPGSSLELSKSVIKADRIISSKIHIDHRVPLV